MNRVILVVLMFFISSNVMADWIKLDRGSNYTAYADFTTINKTGNKVKMWILFDLDAAEVASNGQLQKSIKAQMEFDCNGRTLRTIYEAGSSGHMGSGGTVSRNNNPNNWIPFAPDSINEYIWQLACDKT